MEVHAIFRKYKDGSIIVLFPYKYESEELISAYYKGSETAVNYELTIAETSAANPKETKIVREILSEPPYGLKIMILERRNKTSYLRTLEQYRVEKNLQLK